MGKALDTFAFTATNPSTTVTAATAVSGDSLQIRTFSQPAQAKLLEIWRQGATEGIIGLRSPSFHDNVRGIRINVSETPSVFILPPSAEEPLQAGDTTIAELTGGSAEVDAGACLVWYSDLPGADAKLFMWSDIVNSIEHIKPLEVDFNTSGTAGVWADNKLTTTEDLLKADRRYAVLGYVLDTAGIAFGVKGAATSNYRTCGPASTASDDTANWFIYLSQRTGLPTIPVFNSNDKNAYFVSMSAVATTTAVKSVLILAQLAQSFVI